MVIGKPNYCLGVYTFLKYFLYRSRAALKRGEGGEGGGVETEREKGQRSHLGKQLEISAGLSSQQHHLLAQLCGELVVHLCVHLSCRQTEIHRSLFTAQ